VDLTCRLVSIDGRPVLSVSGEIDLATVPALRDHLRRAIGLHPGAELAVDLDGVSALDDVGLGVLLGAAGHARELGGEVVLVCTAARLLARLHRTGLDRAIEVRATVTSVTTDRG
jgi:anti-sigma B factor antagonist